MAKRYFILIFLFLPLSLILIRCKPSELQEFELYRFTDHLHEKNIVESPLKELIKEFELIKDDLTKKWTHLPFLSSEELDVWAAPSKFPILGFSESEKPEGMKITKGRKELEFIGDDPYATEGWRWIQASKTVEIRQDPKYSRKVKGLILREGDSTRIEEILPDGELKLIFRVSQIDCQDCKPRLTVRLNDKLIKDISLKKRRLFIIKEKTASTGKFTLEFKHEVPKERTKKNRNNFFVIRSVEIETPKDIILLNSLKSDRKVPPSGKYRANYYTYLSESSQDPDSAREDFLSLYVLKEKYPIQDLGIENNPYSIIQKAFIDEYSLNCLFAPPRSRFEFYVKIPENSYLRFGYGFLNESLGKTNKRANFRVELEHKKETVTLFSGKLRPSDRKIAFEKIDMSPYANEKVKIFLTTDTDPSQKKKNSKLSNTFSVWVNPIIYKTIERNRINFILLSIDTLRADHLSCYGYSRKTSPHLDKLVDDSVLFENTFSTTSWTLPAHVALLTSLNSPNHHVMNALHKLNPASLTLADILRKNSYFCASFTGGGYLSHKYGFSKGFDLYQEIRKDDTLSVRLDEAESLYRRLSEWLDKNHDKRFFLFLHTYQPHAPYENNARLGKVFLNENSKWNRIRTEEVFSQKGKYNTVLSKEERENVIALYDGEIRYTDEYLIKPMIDRLKELNIYDNTMIIITSDHGEEFYEHKNWLHASALYNESVKIPLIIKFPDSRYKGMKIPYIVRITDIMPTMLEVARINPSPFRLEGKSLLSMTRGKEKSHRTFYCDLNLRRIKDSLPSQFATNKDSLKLIWHKKIKSAYIRETVAEMEGEKIELYDIKNDSNEIKNIANRRTHKKLCKDLIERLDQYSKRVGKTKAESIKMDEELKRTLKALGYIR